ncbi:MAG: helix-turn-helix domain-containing protein [Candidatus Omnitrophica bacterium]|nr:helix-turn-helix domain-containing protein [Candidatus Omnitrophota bacterium]
MGIIHKLKPEIKDFILEQKKTNSRISCRKLSGLLQKKYQIKLSKSSINAIFKNTGLSMPVGRRKRLSSSKPVKETLLQSPLPATPEAPSQERSSGIIILKAVDYLLGGSQRFSEIIQRKIGTDQKDILSQIERIIYGALYMSKEEETKSSLSYLNEFQYVTEIKSDMALQFSNVFRETRNIKVDLSENEVLYLDARLHTIWSTPYTPYDFDVTTSNISSYIHKHLQENVFLLGMAPVNDIPGKDFFDFINGLYGQEKSILKFTLCGNNFEELEVITPPVDQRCYCVFGAWPWQFREYRKVNKIGEFNPFYFSGLKKYYYIAQVEIELLQPIEQQRVTLIGVALKTALAEKARLLILTNLPAESVSYEKLADDYLNRWPNLEEGFEDFNRKIELFTYTAGLKSSFLPPKINLNKAVSCDVKDLLAVYSHALDLYLKCYFAPTQLQKDDSPSMKECFYGLEAIPKKEKNNTFITFSPPAGYPFPQELAYLCRRLNERELFLPDKTRLRFCVI